MLWKAANFAESIEIAIVAAAADIKKPSDGVIKFQGRVLVVCSDA